MPIWARYVLLVSLITVIAIGLLGLAVWLLGDLAVILAVLAGFTMPLWLLLILEWIGVDEW